MNKYRRLFLKKQTHRNYNKFEGNIVRSNISKVLYANSITKFFLEELEKLINTGIRAIKKYRLMFRIVHDSDEKDFH